METRCNVVLGEGKAGRKAEGRKRAVEGRRRARTRLRGNQGLMGGNQKPIGFERSDQRAINKPTTASSLVHTAITTLLLFDKSERGGGG
jgi:hypothetical protein